MSSRTGGGRIGDLERGTSRSGVLVAVLVAAALGAAVVAIVQLDTTGKTGSGLSEAYAYNLSQLAKIDPNLILYAESGPAIRTGLVQSRAIALDAAGRIYVAGDKAIHVFGASGNLEKTFSLTGEPQCLHISDDGGMYIGMRDHVEVLDAQGKVIASWEPLGEEAVLTSIARHGDAVFVADAGHRIVLQYDTAGTLVGHVGEKDPDRNIPGFFVPSPHFDLAISRDGMLRVADPGRNRIDTFTSGGDLEFFWGERSVGIKGFCGCCNPVSFALLPDGGFVTAEKGLVRVKVYNSDGAFVGVVAGPDQFAGGKQMKVCETPEECQGTALDVAAGADGRIYVLDPADNTVKVFRKKGADQ
jgi:DNA-binding beta-propeller fold protein YncE